MIKDIINQKRLGKALTKEELETCFLGYLKGEVPDYQMAALLMAICINGMTDEETFYLTDLFLHSGDILDFSNLPGIQVDKHSTGGVGDKTTLVVVPLVAACGVPIIKMSGRGLGYTGGTVDKLESIPGYRIELSKEEIEEQVRKIGAVMIAQSATLCPLDKKIYALRDVSGTTESIPLIAASIMSKKIALGADKILIDIKVGRGAFMKTEADAKKLSDLMIAIGKFYQKEVRTVFSNMDSPLGECVGNSLEVREALEVLEEKKEGDFLDLCIQLATEMVSMGKEIPEEEAKDLVLDALYSKKAYSKFLEIVDAQGGNLKLLSISKNQETVTASSAGIVQQIDALEIAKLSYLLGAGRKKKEDKIDPSVGVSCHVFVGQHVKVGDPLLTLYKKEGDFSNYSWDSIFKIL